MKRLNWHRAELARLKDRKGSESFEKFPNPKKIPVYHFPAKVSKNGRIRAMQASSLKARKAKGLVPSI